MYYSYREPSSRRYIFSTFPFLPFIYFVEHIFLFLFTSCHDFDIFATGARRKYTYFTWNTDDVPLCARVFGRSIGYGRKDERLAENINRETTTFNSALIFSVGF